MKENIEELKRLLYTDTLTQCGKRKLINYYEKEIRQLQKEKEDWEKAYQEENDKQFDLLKEILKLQEENEKLKEKWKRYT